MLDTDNNEDVKRLSMTERQAATDAAVKRIISSELSTRLEKTEKLRQARMAAGWVGIKKKR
jgi:hypothetical protein